MVGTSRRPTARSGGSLSQAGAGKHERRARVFISYPREELAFVQQLAVGLEARGVEAWYDVEKIRPSQDWLKAILGAIDRSDAFVCVMAPPTFRSEYTQLEVNHAEDRKKRILPIRRCASVSEAPWLSLAQRQWIDVSAAIDDAALAAIASAIRDDFGWLEQHTRLLELAARWQALERPAELLLRGHALREAEQWLAEASGEQRRPLQLHSDFIDASRAHGVKTRTLQRLGAALVLFISLVAALGIYAWRAERDQRARSEVRMRLEQDELGPHVPIDLVRRSALEVLHEQAVAVGFKSDETARKLGQLPRLEHRQVVLPASATRQNLGATNAGNHIVVWDGSGVEWLSADTGRVVGKHPVPRGKVVHVEPGLDGDDVAVDVEYPDFADAERAARVAVVDGVNDVRYLEDNATDGETERTDAAIEGSERELFLISAARDVRSLGLLVKLFEQRVDADPEGEGGENVWRPRIAEPGISTNMSADAIALARTERLNQELRKRFDLGVHKPRIVTSDQPVALDVVDPHALHIWSGVSQEIAGAADTTFEALVLLGLKESVHALVVELVNADKEDIYFGKGELHDFEVQAMIRQQSPFRVPKGPFALSVAAGIAVAGQLVIRFGAPTKFRYVPDALLDLELEEQWPSGVPKVVELEEDAQYVAAHPLRHGRGVVFEASDGTLSYYDLDAKVVARKFLAPPPHMIRGKPLSTLDGAWLYLLRSDGSLERWKWEAFGPTGWAAPARSARY